MNTFNEVWILTLYWLNMFSISAMEIALHSDDELQEKNYLYNQLLYLDNSLNT